MSIIDWSQVNDQTGTKQPSTVISKHVITRSKAATVEGHVRVDISNIDKTKPFKMEIAYLGTDRGSSRGRTTYIKGLEVVVPTETNSTVNVPCDWASHHSSSDARWSAGIITLSAEAANPAASLDTKYLITVTAPAEGTATGTLELYKAEAVYDNIDMRLADANTLEFDLNKDLDATHRTGFSSVTITQVVTDER